MIWKLLGGKSSRILAITLIAGWVWQVTCTVLACREHQGVLGVAALLSLGLSAVTFIATLLPDECCRPLKSRMLPSHSYSPTSFKSCCCCKDSLFVVCFSISSCLTLVSIASEQRGASSSDIGLELSSLCLIALAAPAVLCKLCGDCGSSSLYNLSSGLGVVSVFAAWCLTQSLNLVAYIVLCILYTSTTVLLPTSTNQDLPEDEEQKRLLLRNSSSKDFRCISEISVVANSAHDLKTPLTSFMLGVDNALETLFAIRQIMEQVDSAKANCIAHLLSSAELCLSNCRKTNQFMFMSINRMMDCAKSARGLLLSPKYETASLLESLKLPLDCVRSLRSEVLIVLEPLPEELSRYIITDKQWLQENLLCLLSNAVKYSHRGNVTVRTKLQRSQGSIRFEVEDEGIGMSEEVMDSLFSPFQQSQRLAGGTGLGLFSLAKRIEALKGDCGVQKRGDGKQGSLFWFSMRYRPDDSVDMSGAAEQLVAECELQSIDSISTCGDGGYSSGSSIASTHHIFSQDSADEDSRITETFTEAPALTGVISQSIYIPRVLLVEDTLSIMKMTSMMLCRQGYEVVTASNGAAALDLIEAEYREFEEGSRSNALVFDVVLMDLQMPIMDGIEATKRLRRWEQQGCTSSGYKVPLHRNQQLKIVGLSANSDEAVLQATRHAGFDGFISKPFRMAALLHFLS